MMMINMYLLARMVNPPLVAEESDVGGTSPATQFSCFTLLSANFFTAHVLLCRFEIAMQSSTTMTL
jgi:hypothetical protein